MCDDKALIILYIGTYQFLLVVGVVHSFLTLKCCQEVS